MKTATSLLVLTGLLCTTILTSPMHGSDVVKLKRDGNKVKVYRDDDHDGHFAKKGEYSVRRRGYNPYYYGGHYDSPYYNRYYYSRPYHYGRPYYYPRYYYGPSVGVTINRSHRYNNDALEATVQRELRRLGYYRGPIDGDLGPGSRAAIRRFQADTGLRVTGRIDSSTLRALGV